MTDTYYALGFKGNPDEKLIIKAVVKYVEKHNNWPENIILHPDYKNIIDSIEFMPELQDIKRHYQEHVGRNNIWLGPVPDES